ncbi:MAG: hypothetical protein LPK38_03045 [Actinomycetes bacterium]|nr:hypothetical protein [Actinomycetes bacterium]MDX5380267.1 hypothetical protein [Actinomycetes bacterium]MDX5398985.1 hypothetical protein [Actinomycetes bacterium]MDX5449996.1 hypothetical protein [Actinomycetes bacterium]
MARRHRERFVAPPLPEAGPEASRRQQAIGAAVIAVVALILAAAVPWVGEELAGRHLRAGDTLSVSGSIELTVAEGWSLGDGGGFFTVLENGDAQLVALPAVAVAEDGTAEEVMQRNVDALSSDTTQEWEFSPLEVTTSDAGHEVRHVVARSATDVQDLWAVSDGEGVASVIVTAPADGFDRVADSVAQMVLSVTFLGGAQ